MPPPRSAGRDEAGPADADPGWGGFSNQSALVNGPRVTAPRGRFGRYASLLALCAVLLTACGPAQQPQSQVEPPKAIPSLGVKYGSLLGQVPFTFLGFANLVKHDVHPDGDLFDHQAAPVVKALRTLDAALERGAAPRGISVDMAILVLADQRLLLDLRDLPGLTGYRLAAWEQGFSADGKTEQTAFTNVLHDFGLPSVGNA